MTLASRTAVISGATGGLGSVLARDLGRREANLVLVARSPEKQADLLQSLDLPAERVLAVPADLLDPAQARAAAQAAGERFGAIHILLHVVGGWTGGKTLVDAERADLEQMLNQHVWTSFNVVQAFVPHLVRSGWGRIIMVTSPSAARPPAKGGPYAIAKAGQEALMLALSQELKGSGVTANLLQARSIDTKHEKLSNPSAEKSAWTTSEELSAAVQFLLSEEAGTINGAKLPMFGAYS
jgi:NAD(P)-dependent dehydrogenase (short-subunit alcohol dehydrogenase family)